MFQVWLCADFLSRLYDFFHIHATLLVIIQIVFLFLTVFMSFGPVVRKKVKPFFCGLLRRLTKFFKIFKPKSNKNKNTCSSNVKRSRNTVITYQVILLVFSIMSVLFLYITGDDFYIASQRIALLSVCLILALTFALCFRKADGKESVALILGIVNVLLAFTCVYYYLVCTIKGSFENIETPIFHNPKALFECFCYSFSVIMPSSITISKAFPLSGWSKLATVLQVVMFYGFLLSRLADIFRKWTLPKKELNDNTTGKI